MLTDTEKPCIIRDTIQDNCKYGYVLPDRRRYTRHLGCDCGAYPAIENPVSSETIRYNRRAI
jgi:hypothetical protein